MKIVDVTPLVCDAGWRPWIFVKVVTSDGTVGYGECSDNRSPHAVLGAIEDFRQMAIGRDPRHVEALYWDMYRATRHSAGGVVQKAIAGINCALLDVLAKSLDVPVFQLFGGPTRQEIPVYWTHLGSYRIQHGKHLGTPEVRSIDDIIELAVHAKNSGFRGIKTNAIDVSSSPPHVIAQGFGGGSGSTDRLADNHTAENLANLMGGFREELGADYDVAIDLNFNFTPESVIRIASALEQFNLAWIETDSFDPAVLREIKDSTSTPICSGEALYTTVGYKPFFENRALDIAMIDIPWNGFSMARKVADMAEAYEINVCPHNYYSHLSTNLAAHLCAVIPNVRYLELEVEDVPWKDDIVDSPPVLSNGSIQLPEGPGWGLNLNEDEIKKHPWNG